MTLPVGRIDRDDLVLAVAGVEDRQDRLAGMHGDLDRQIAQPHLAPGRLERPAVGQEDRARAGHARARRSFLSRSLRLSRPRRFFGLGRMLGGLGARRLSLRLGLRRLLGNDWGCARRRPARMRSGSSAA